MTRLLILAIAVAAMVFTSNSNASAQSYNNGYGFGTGVLSSGGFGSGAFAGGFTAPPYFAQFPPVYYSGIVRRPYGISPYAAPAGIAPVELNALNGGVVVQPLTVKNPYMNQSRPAAATSKPVKAAKPTLNNKTTWVKNPHFVSEIAKAPAETESVLLASAAMEMPLIDAIEIAFFK